MVKLSSIQSNNNLNFDYPKISVIIPNYNYGEFLEEAILSVLNQSYSNIELIVIDGGSSDNSVDIIKKYQSHIFYWISEKDNGQTDAINKGLSKANGEYVCYLNSDDAYIGDAFEEIFKKSNSRQADFIFGKVYAGRDLKNVTIFGSNRNVFNLKNLVLFFYHTNYIIPSQSVLIKKSFLLKHDILNLKTNLKYCMDMDWYCRIWMHNPISYRYKGVHCFFRIHPKTKTKSQSDLMRYESIEIALAYLPKLDAKDQLRFFKYLFLSKIMRKIYRHNIQSNFYLMVSLIKRLGITGIWDRRVLGIYKRSIIPILYHSNGTEISA